MIKNVQYVFDEVEFNELRPYLTKFNYDFHPLDGLNFIISKDGTRSFKGDHIQVADGGECDFLNFYVKMDTRDSDLIECIDSHFKRKK